LEKNLVKTIKKVNSNQVAPLPQETQDPIKFDINIEKAPKHQNFMPENPSSEEEETPVAKVSNMTTLLNTIEEVPEYI
jgi:hypothetical protein